MMIQRCLSVFTPIIDRLDCELLIAHVIKKRREYVLSHPEHTLTQKEYSDLTTIVHRRRAHEPLAYITESKDFFKYNFYVNNSVLIPRPETETLIEHTLSFLSHKKLASLTPLTILDIGTGSGNIIITLFLELQKKILHVQKKISFYASDISPHALRVAKYNATAHNIEKEITFYKSDLLSSKKFRNDLIKQLSQNHVNNLLLVANLPYIPTTHEKILRYNPSSFALQYEPSDSLYAGNDGLLYYKKLIHELVLLKHDMQHVSVTCFFEIDPSHAQQISQLIQDIFPSALIEISNDLSSIQRFCLFHIT